MPSRTLVSVAEYLRTSYDPDCDYVDGEIVERNVGERDHSELQGEIYGFIRSLRRNLNVHPYIEQRAWVYTKDGGRASKDGILPTENPEIELPLPEIFQALQ